MNRQVLSIAIVAAISAITAPLSGFSQTPPNPVEAIQIKGDIYRFSGTMANCVMLKDGESVIVVDSAETPELAKEMLAAIDKIHGGSVEYLVNTHWHFDHVNGNPVFAEAGATIVAQSSVRAKLEQTPTQEGKAILPKSARPEICFDQDLTIFFGDETVYIYHPETDGAHTMGDSVVYFKNANVIAMGDLFFTGMYPYIDPQDNGWPQGMAASLRDVAKMIDDKTIVIPGHGPVSDKKGMLQFADMMDEIGRRVKTQMDQGKTLDEIKASKPTAEWDEEYGKVWMNGDTFVELVWNDLKNHH